MRAGLKAVVSVGVPWPLLPWGRVQSRRYEAAGSTASSSEPRWSPYRDDSASYPGRRRHARDVEYVHLVRRSATPAAVLLRPADRVRGGRERARGRLPARPARRRRTTSPWFAVPATACSCSPLLARRRFRSPPRRPVWLLGAGALVRRRAADPVQREPLRRRDGGRVPAREPAGRAAGVASASRSRSAASTIVDYNNPSHAAGEFVFIPLRSRSAGWPASRSASGPSRRRPPRRARHRPSASATRRPASPSPRSGRGSRASCTTSSPTRSA